jgi:hypothetical protein
MSSPHLVLELGAATTLLTLLWWQQTVTNSSPQHTKGVYPRSADERRLFGDFEYDISQ